MHRQIPGLLVAMSLFAGLGFAAEPAVPQDGLERRAQEIVAVLPDGWSAHVDARYSLVVVERTQAVTIIDKAPSGPARRPGDPPPMGTIRLLLRVLPAMSKAELESAKKSNADREKALEMLRAQMKDLQEVAVKPNALTEDFAARTPDQQARLDAFVAVKRALPEKFIPGLFAPDGSFRLEEDTYRTPTDETVRMEISNVRAKVEALYSKVPLT